MMSATVQGGYVLAFICLQETRNGMLRLKHPVVLVT